MNQIPFATHNTTYNNILMSPPVQNPPQVHSPQVQNPYIYNPNIQVPISYNSNVQSNYISPVASPVHNQSPSAPVYAQNLNTPTKQLF